MTNKIFSIKMAFTMDKKFQERCAEIKKKFAPLTQEERYLALIELGRSLLPYPPELQIAEKQVRGCQSTLYLNASLKDGQLFFEAKSDALISAGLAALLIALYSGQTPETILTQPPTVISELGLTASLTPSRSNGLAHIHLRMKQEALRILS